MGEIKRFDIPVSAPEFRVSGKSGTTRTKRTGPVMREVLVATFNPSADTSHRSIGAHGLGVYLPTKAIITGVWYDVVTTFTSATDAATIAIHAQSAGDFTAAVAISAGGDLWDAGIRGSKVGTIALDGNALTQLAGAAAMAATFIKTTAQREITATVAVEALTAGKANIYVEYVLSD